MAGHSRPKDGVASARLCPGHPRLCSVSIEKVRRGCPGHLARRRASRFCPGMTPFFSLAGKLPINAMPMQRHDDARPDPEAHAVPPAAPRHHRSSPGRRASGSGARGAVSVPLHPGRAGLGPFGPARLGPVRLGLARLSLGLDGRGPLDIFRRFRSFRTFRCIRSPRGRRSICRLAAAKRQASIASLRRRGGQNKSCNQNEFTHVCISPSG
jgi:hypothetical protein